MVLTASIALVDPRRQIAVLDPAGQLRPLTSSGGEILWGSWHEAEHRDVHSWPTWSPDGRQLACFRIGRSMRRGNRVLVSDVEGVASAEVAAVGPRLPIYLQWSHGGSRVGILSQQDEVLVLQDASTVELGEPRMLLAGSPLFFTWVDDERMAVFVGDERRGPQMLIIDPDGTRHELPGSPGNFCAPVLLGGRLVYVAHVEGRVAVLASSLDGTAPDELEDIDGLAALLPSADGTKLARAVAPDGEGSPYGDLRIFDAASGGWQELPGISCLAFFWVPGGEALVIAQRDERRGAVRWSRVDLDGEVRPLVDLHPTRDMRFYLRFFEQYGLSHPIVDPSGSHLVLAGGLQGEEDPGGTPRLWAVPLDGGAPEELGEGLFATFGPVRP